MMTPDGLRAASAHQLWTPGDNHALCRKTDHPAPNRSCHCGYYGLYQPEQLSVAGYYIRGAICARGDVMLHSQGFRAQTARVLALQRPESRSPLIQRQARQMAALYQVPLLDDVPQLTEYAEQYASTIPSRRRRKRKQSHQWDFAADWHKQNWRRRKEFLRISCTITSALMCTALLWWVSAMLHQTETAGALSLMGISSVVYFVSLAVYLWAQRQGGVRE